MRNLKILLTLLVLGCSFKSGWSQLPSVNFSKSEVVIIDLGDSLGKVTVESPSLFDTLFILRDTTNWMIPGDRQQYIFKPKNPSLNLKRKSAKEQLVPSKEHFAVIHTRLYPIKGIYDTPVYGRRQLFKGRILKEFAYRDRISGNVENINKREFFVTYTSGYDRSKNRHFALLAAVTMVQDHDIEFHYFFEARKKFDTKVFFKNSLILLKSVRLSNGI